MIALPPGFGFVDACLIVCALQLQLHVQHGGFFGFSAFSCRNERICSIPVIIAVTFLTGHSAVNPSLGNNFSLGTMSLARGYIPVFFKR